MSDLTFYDAAYPPNPEPHADGFCFYLPGGDEFHAWDRAEVESQTARYRLPVFVRSNPPGPGAAADVKAAVGALKSLGAPTGILICWDMETAADPSYIHGVYDGLKAAGFVLIVYGSQSTVMGNDVPSDLYFGADWSGVPHLHNGDAITQWVSFAGYDLDLAESSLPFWDTRPPAPHPSPSQEEPMAYILSSLAHGTAVALPVPSGKTKAVVYADPGYGGGVAPEIRVGTAPHWNGGPNVKPEWGKPATVTLPAGTTEVTVGRVDTGDDPITVDFA